MARKNSKGKTAAARRQESAASVDIELKKELYFPTQIYFCDVPGAKTVNKQLVEAIYALRDGDPHGIVRSNVKRIGSWHSATDLNHRKEFHKFTRLLDAVVNQIYQDLGYDPATRAVCDNMWANINPRHGYNRYHTHPNVLWSGVYYVRAPAGSGRIHFRDPREQAQSVTPRFPEGKERTRELWSEVYYEPGAGRLIVFPAWLGHEVEPNLTTEEGADGDRISISFNYVQRMP